MYSKDLLFGINILDLTQRLPGPFATQILAGLGARVTKATPIGKEDAFIKEGKVDYIFSVWYENLNKNKIIKSINFEDELQLLIDKSDIILTSSSTLLSTFSLKEKAVLITKGGSGKLKSMHDLNAISQTKSFHLYTHNKNEAIIDPPYLPFAGIAFAQQMATEALALLLKVKMNKETITETVYLDQVTPFIFDHFWNEELDKKGDTKFLHNGLFPCYNIYRTKDAKYVSLAAVEEKFWLKFSEIFKLSLKKEDRFDTSEGIFNLLIKTFSSLTLSEIIHLVGSNDICLTFVD